MLDREKILRLFEKLNEKLKARDIKGEIGIVGGAVMCVVYQARVSTKDIDGIFVPTAIIRDLANSLAEEEEIEPNWLNDGAKGYLVDGFKRNDVVNLSNLSVWAPEANYMLAMKCLSARYDTEDKNDVIFLLKHLKIATPEAVFKIVTTYYPNARIPTKTQFFIEELLDKKSGSAK
jgi:hypothetical protein